MAPDYGKIASLLSSNSIFNSVSELHGVVSGLICAGSNSMSASLVQQLMGLEESFPPIIEQLVARLGVEILSQMNEGDFAFSPLLPSDDEELSLRLHGLGQWCEGFNIGFGGGFGKGDKSLLEETREVLKDFSAISEIEDAPEDEEGDESEESYMEIVEYARMAAATVFMQNGKSASMNKQGSEVGTTH